MRRRERGAVRNELDIDRRGDGFRERNELLVRAALRHGVAGDDDRPLGLGEQIGGGGDRGGVAAHARRHARRFEQIDVGVVLEDVAGQRQEYRPGRRRQRGLHRAVHVARQVFRAMHLGGPFDERPRQRRQVRRQHRLGDEIFEVLLAGGDQHRRVGLHGVVEHAHGVAEPGRDMEIEHREIAGGLRIAVGHRHQRGLLKPENVTDVVLDREGVHQRQFGGAGIAEHDRDALLLEQIEEGAFSGHYGQDSPPSVVIPGRGEGASPESIITILADLRWGWLCRAWRDYACSARRAVARGSLLSLRERMFGWLTKS